MSKKVPRTFSSPRLELIDGESGACLEAVGGIEAKIKPLQEKLTNKAKFERLSGELEKEIQKLADIERKELEIAKLESGWNSDQIFEVYGQLYACYVNIVAELKQYSKIDARNGINLIAEVKFKQVRFDGNFCAKISKKTTLRNQFGNTFSEDANKFVFTPDQHIGDVREIFERLVGTGGAIKLNQGFNLDDVVHALMDDNFYVEYDLKQRDDRQIIIVSHNANLVVSTDSEEIIVANQHGENRGAENAEYRFEYVTGALEDKFKDMTQKGVLYQKGIRNHVCEILEGGEEAFKKREEKYALS